MGIIKKIMSIFFQTLKFLMFVLAFLYFFIWTTQIFAIDLFEKLNGIFGFLPDYFDEIIGVDIVINGEFYSLGYIYCALFLIVAALILTLLTKKPIVETGTEENIKEEKIEPKKNVVLEKTEKKEPKIIKQKKEEKINFFFALFEFKLKYTDENEKSYTDIKKLKKEYSKIIERKLNEKYSSNLKFFTSDKVFFICNDFSLINSIVSDILRLYEVIENIDRQKSIETNYLFTLYASLKNTDIKENLKILHKINEYKNLNKVVINHDVYLKYWDLKDKIFDFKPMDNVKLLNINSTIKTLEVDLYYIKNII